MKISLNLAALLTLALAVGCESEVPKSDNVQKTTTGQAPPPPAAAGPKGAKNNEIVKPQDPAGKSAPKQAAAAQPATPPPAAVDDATLKPAEAGVGVKGKDYGGPGFITTPVAAKFRIEERIAFEAQIPKAMQLYKAEHNDKGPKTHEEFMDVIIREHGVSLPELPAGETYVYVPETEELLVKSPAAPGQD